MKTILNFSKIKKIAITISYRRNKIILLQVASIYFFSIFILSITIIIII